MVPNFQEHKLCKLAFYDSFVEISFADHNCNLVTLVLCKMVDGKLSHTCPTAGCSLCCISQPWVYPLTLRTILSSTLGHGAIHSTCASPHVNDCKRSHTTAL